MGKEMSKAERQRKYRESIRKRMEVDPVFAEEFRVKARSRQEKYRANHPEKVRLAGSYSVNKKSIVASRKRHIDTRRANDATRRARKKLVGGTYTEMDVLNLRRVQKGLCAMCRASFGGGYQVDHIMPLALGGSNERSNLQLLCRPCNTSKGAKHPVDFAQQRGLLL